MDKIILEKRNLMIIAITAISVAALFTFYELDNETLTVQKVPSALQPAVADLDGVTHDIEIHAVELPDDLFAYRIESHTIDVNEDVIDVRYASKKASIPGPTLIFTEGDIVNVTFVNDVPCENFPDIVDGSPETPNISRIGIHPHGVHYDITDDGTPKRTYGTDSSATCGGGEITYTWNADDGTRGTWPYHDHTFLSEIGAEDRGLFGTIIVNPRSGFVNGIVSSEGDTEGEIVEIEVSDISKDYILWMVSTETLGRSVFYGMEIDHDSPTLEIDSQGVGRQTPLWVNPTLLARDGDTVRFHILGMGDDIHSFHLHGHRWIEPTEASGNIIDVREIAPLERHTFIVKASDNGKTLEGTENWMYHCHVFSHMEQGMAGKFRVIEGDDTLPTLGAVFTISDEPGLWFKTLDAGIIDALDPREGIGFPLDFLGGDFADSEGRSLAVIKKGESVLFNMKDSQTLHTVTSLIWPAGATTLDLVLGIQFDNELALRGSTYIQDSNGVPVTLDTPGLYVYTCKIHPYMFAAVIVDDDGALPLDLGSDLIILTRTAGFPTIVPDPVATAPNLATALLTTFYVVTDPSNWKDYTTGSWEVNHPPVPVTDGTDTVLLSILDIGPVAISIDEPNKQGVGEVWVDTQFERTINKNFDGTPADKPGTITVVDAKTWDVERKIALPEINMNHPHNMWTDTKQEVVYQTQWFDSRMVTIDRESGEMIKDVFVGQSPSHVMTAPDTGKLYIAMNGEEQITEMDPNTLEITRQISVGENSHPHGHWISSDGRFIVTPNFFSFDSSIVDLSTDPPTVIKGAAGIAPIATGMMPDSSKFYTADFLGNTLSVVDPTTGALTGPVGTIDLLAGVDGTGVGAAGLPIQTPVSPDGKWVVTANVLFSRITVVDTSTDTVVASLDCDPGCHGVQWGAKKGGGYYAYVSNKFSNALIVVNPDPNKDGDGHDAEVAGTVLLTKQFDTEIDDRIIDHAGMGGQGLLPIPNVYNGWIQETVAECGKTSDPCSQEIVKFLKQLTQSQKNPEVDPEPGEEEEEEEEED